MLRQQDLDRAIQRANVKRELKLRLYEGAPTFAERRSMLLDLMADVESDIAARQDTGRGQLEPAKKVNGSKAHAPEAPPKKTASQRAAELLLKSDLGISTEDAASKLQLGDTKELRNYRARNAFRWLQKKGQAEYSDGRWFKTSETGKAEERPETDLFKRIRESITNRGGETGSMEIIRDVQIDLPNASNTHIYNTLKRLSERGKLVKSTKDGRPFYALPNGGTT